MSDAKQKGPSNAHWAATNARLRGRVKQMKDQAVSGAQKEADKATKKVEETKKS